jgi:hypothetical protein
MKDLAKNLGGLSTPSKMPCQGWSISAKKCKMGSRLRQIPNSVCSKCYALRGNYPFPAVVNCHAKRLKMYFTHGWVQNMARVINGTEASGYFRWFDAGDLQSVAMLRKIVAVCVLTPSIRHWLPTKEYGMVQNFLRSGGSIPSNLNIRLSAYMRNEEGPVAFAAANGLTVSGVGENYTCPAPLQGKKCLTCRTCWDKNVMSVTYHPH